MRIAGKKKPGIVFVVAIVALAAMTLIGASFMGAAVQQLNDARRDLDAVHALTMADAGINYFIWKQRHSDFQISQALQPPNAEDQGFIHDLTPTGAQTPQITPAELSFGDDQAAVWLFTYSPAGSSATSYEVISKGYYRSHSRTVRAVLQGPMNWGSSGPPSWLNYSIFADAQMVINTSTNITGDLASNGSIVLNMSGGGGINGNVRAASNVQVMKNATSVTGNLLYGTKVLDRNGKDISSSASGYFSEGAGRISDDEDKKIPVAAMNPQLYADWAAGCGESATYESTHLSTSTPITTPILYVNADLTPNYTLSIDSNIPGPLTIFVNGNIELAGNTTLGSAGNPVAIIATGNITCKGTCDINGMAWANGTFGGGTPTVNGSVRCTTTGNYQGNPQFNWHHYDQNIIDPPDLQNMWALMSWELL